ncbi:uncharacterized protein Z520_10059 [Fonsecaea multimorphosa CBS 102226]|uniref:Enoyl reductase (ER) domain-containing protein n=1 Tax=Fonsecaea multimorphosa CBS 102226 TaxID=1442371 RepID=A0A0D2JUZ2_9EURO|nr:uncharacterized protein Z520_10059 [Fonsecaea multimorphosa CBS 102226]KIX94349.1 hypothetical protein Z520_10059 [Fonsecaea multimorphosa CBS 102226]OAL19681.1 hypothetical protein AYO22_09553 [Fonsecaea multimorphosa]
MRAQVLEAYNEPYRLHEVPRHNSPQGQDLLIKVQAASYCHTDAVLAAGLRPTNLPRVGSHEIAGVIEEIGPQVDPSRGFKINTRVGVPARTYHSCGTCSECQHPEADSPGYSIFCEKSQGVGLDVDGGFQDYCLVDSRQCVVIPDSLSAVDTAPLMCAGLTIWNALLRAGVPLKENGGANRKIAILGAGGGLGHLGVQFAAKLGCKVVAVDASDKPLQLLRNVVDRLGPDGKQVMVVDARSQKVEEIRTKVNEGSGSSVNQGVDASIVLPENQLAFNYAMKLLGNHGTCVVVSFPEDGFKVDAKDLVYRDIRLMGSLCGRIQQLQEMIDFTVKHGIKSETRVYSLENVNDLVADYHAGVGGKLVVDLTLSAPTTT